MRIFVFFPLEFHTFYAMKWAAQRKYAVRFIYRKDIKKPYYLLIEP